MKNCSFCVTNIITASLIEVNQALSSRSACLFKLLIPCAFPYFVPYAFPSGQASLVEASPPPVWVLRSFSDRPAVWFCGSLSRLKSAQRAQLNPTSGRMWFHKFSLNWISPRTCRWGPSRKARWMVAQRSLWRRNQRCSCFLNQSAGRRSPTYLRCAGRFFLATSSANTCLEYYGS